MDTWNDIWYFINFGLGRYEVQTIRNEYLEGVIDV